MEPPGVTETSGHTWLAGLRRSHVERGVLDRWAEARGVTGVVWSPDAFAQSDYATAVANLAEAGARPDESLLWDFAVTDVREAAEALRTIYRGSDGADGYAVLWLRADKLADPGRAAAHAREAMADVNRENVALGFAWTSARASCLSSIVAEGISVAVSGCGDEASIRVVADARDRGMQRRRKDLEDEDVEEVHVFLLGSQAGEGFVHGVRLVSEIGLLAPGRRAPAGVPLTSEEESSALDRTLTELAQARTFLEDDAPDSFADAVEARCSALDRVDVVERVWGRDHTVWREDPAEIADRLGWLDVAVEMRARVGELKEFAHRARSGGVTDVVLLGMGGSSLAPETLYRTLGGGVRLTVLDSTDPDHVLATRRALEAERTLFVVSSKSGTTVETLSHLEYFWSLTSRGDRFVAITDPGTPLGELARDRGFLRTFENPPDIGGRYSALSYFGLVPAAVCGIDAEALLDGALGMMKACAACVPPELNPGVRLGAAMGDAAADGRDKLTLVLPPGMGALGAWIEQLVAESTGKAGTGIVPVDGEDLGPREIYGGDRLFVAYDPAPPGLEAIEAEQPVVRMKPEGLGAEFFRWELATAVAGHILGIHPFDQPDVESAKQRTREALEASGPPPDRGDARSLIEGIGPPQYVAIQAFLAPSAENAARLHAVRMRLRDRYGVATTCGFGPRFLHSTGQLHKGGPDTGAFLQVTGTRSEDVEVPGKPYTFGRLIDAQADGDLRALRDAGRLVARLTLDELDAL